MEKGAEKAALGVAMARSAYLPTIYASASYQLNDNTTPFGRDNDSWSVGATLRWELFDGMRRRNEVGKTVALEKAAAEYVTDYRQEVDFQVVEGFLRSQEVAKRLEVARHAVVDADESVRLLEKRFQNSLATMVELLDAQMALNKARANLVEMENQRARAAVTIYRAAGIFLQEVKK
jgi:outer membrane protein TolC